MLEHDVLQDAGLPDHLRHSFPNTLAYVEWFSTFTDRDDASGLFKLSKSLLPSRVKDTQVISLDLLYGSALLTPRYSSQSLASYSEKEVHATNVLDICSEFLLEHHRDRNLFLIFDDS